MSYNEKITVARLLLPQTNTTVLSAAAVLQFWFEDSRPWQWFRQRDSFDALVTKRFGVLVKMALNSGLGHWEQEPEQALALVLLLDQFTRQVFRGHQRFVRSMLAIYNVKK